MAARGSDHPEGSLTTVWDGKTQTHLDGARRAARIADNATATALEGAEGPTYASLYRMAFGDYTYLRCIRERAATLKRLGTFARVDAPPAPEKDISANTYGVQVDFDSQKSFMPARIVWYTSKKGKRVELTAIDNELSEVQPGVWLPVSGKLTFLIANPESPFFGVPWGFDEIKLDRARSRFNIPIDESVFAVTIPVGFNVNDDIRKVNYVVGAETQGATLDQLAAEGRLGVEKLKEQSAELGEGFWARRTMLIFLSLNSLLLFLIAAGFIIRSRPLHRNRSRS